MASTADSTAASIRETWDARYSRFRLLAALRQADERFGARYAAAEKVDRARLALEMQFGCIERAMRDPEGKAALRLLNEEDDAAGAVLAEVYYDPEFDAAAALLITPAPDAEAVEIKVKLAGDYDFQCYDGLPDPFEAVNADVQRLFA